MKAAESGTESAEIGGFHARTGSWLDAEFPSSGWRFVGIREAAEEDHLCDVCRNARERYLHRLTHDGAGLVVEVGRWCAEQLEGDVYGPEKRERVFRDDLRVINDWPTRKWQISQRGIPYLNSRGYNVSIWPKGNGFGITIRVQNKFGDDFLQHGKLLYDTQEEAKRNALNAVLFARKKFRK